MKLEEKKFEKAPEGLHTGILFSIIDLGKQKTEFNGQAKIKRTLRFSWELPHEQMEDGRPFIVSKQYNAVFAENAAIVLDVGAWLNKPIDRDFDIKSLLGTAGNVGVQHKGDYANITSLAPLKKGETAPPRTNPLVWFDLDNFDADVFSKLSEKTREKIMLSPEYQAIANPKASSAAVAALASADNIPFNP